MPMRLTVTPRFDRAYRKLTDETKGGVNDAIRQFYADPRHPGLHFEKLKGSKYRTIRVDRGRWRIVLRGAGEEFELVDIDRHDAVDRNYG